MGFLCSLERNSLRDSLSGAAVPVYPVTRGQSSTCSLTDTVFDGPGRNSLQHEAHSEIHGIDACFITKCYTFSFLWAQLTTRPPIWCHWQSRSVTNVHSRIETEVFKLNFLNFHILGNRLYYFLETCVAYFKQTVEGSVHKGSISRDPNFSGNEFLCFASFTS